MRPDKWIRLNEVHQPGMRRILEAMKAIEQERSGLVDNVSFAAGERARSRGDGRRTAEQRGHA